GVLEAAGDARARGVIGSVQKTAQNGLRCTCGTQCKPNANHFALRASQTQVKRKSNASQIALRASQTQTICKSNRPPCKPNADHFGRLGILGRIAANSVSDNASSPRFVYNGNRH